ncbi:hypothetical protein MKW94_010785 [Papaver nudicaule]|uniref:Pentatricopeptide repeat-containing protein n=1 Tax=Papaver nudicaule TaxID=74823 RepID=A0AA41V5K5_PAPNU|nr:hypothetical protein [Papaver nudicaule]
MYASLLKECTDTKDIVSGADLHAHINNNRLLLIFLRGPVCYSRDSVSWLIMIAAQVDCKYPEEALHLFNQIIMETSVQHQDLKLCVPLVLRACIHTGEFGLGKQVQYLSWGTPRGILSCVVPLLTFMGNSDVWTDSQRVFDRIIPSRGDTVMWTSLMAAYCKQGHFEVVFELFKKMGRIGVKKNSFTISTVLRACGRFSRGADGNENNDDRGLCGKQVHANAIKLDLVDMYGKCGLIKDSRMAFDWTTCSSKRNDVCWSAMLNTYIQHGSYKESIKLLYLMKSIGIELPESVLSSLRLACAGI